jgi:hypothetical protein
MTFPKRGLRNLALAAAVAGVVLGAASLPATARGFVSFGFGAPAYPTYYDYGPSYYGPSYYAPSYSYYAPPPAYYYPPPPPVYAGPAVNFGFHIR